MTTMAPIIHAGARQVVVRDEAGHNGVRQAIEREREIPIRQPTDFCSAISVRSGGKLGGDASEQFRLADIYQQQSTSREYAPAAAYPSQSRPSEPYREERPKNHQEFEMVGRNIGMHTTSGGDAVGGYAGSAEGAKVELAENLTQRTLDDLAHTYFNPTGPFRFERGNNATYNQFYQGRQEKRGMEFKDTPGRFPGAFRHEYARPGHKQEELWRSGKKGYKPKDTMKSDAAMVHRQRADENPNREGLRPQYYDNYSSGFEKLINPRRKQHTVTNDVDHNLLLAYNTNPFTQVLGQIPPRD